MDFNSKTNEFYIVSTCSHLQKIHMTLSEKHTIKMDNALNRAVAAILVQLGQANQDSTHI
jgi:hypothetical protein